MENLLERVEASLTAKNPVVIYNKVQQEEEVVSDLALIQCFHGISISRVKAVTTAMEFMLQSTRKPSTWVFIECQKNKDDCAFAWLKNYGIKYKFIQSKSDSDGILLKNALWNIGTTLCDESMLCFLDSDVVLCNSDWADKVSIAFKSGHDVLSLSSHQYYEGDDKCKLHESIGHKWVTSRNITRGHCGLSIGMTRKTFDEFGGFDPAIILDDMQTFHRICGTKVFEPFNKWIEPFKFSTRGYNFNLGYADNIACHVDHMDYEGKYYTLVTLLKSCGIRSYSDIINYDKGNFNKLPTWKSDCKCVALKNVILRYYKFLSIVSNKTTFDIVKEFTNEMRKICGRIDETHSLIVATIVETWFGFEVSDLVRFRDMVETRFQSTSLNPSIVFFVDGKVRLDDAKENELNIVALTKDYVEGNEIEQVCRPDVMYPDNAIVYYIPFNASSFNEDLWLPNGKVCFNDGSIITCVGTSKHKNKHKNKKHKG